MRRDFFVCSHCKQYGRETLVFAPRTNDTEVSAQVDGNAIHQCLERISFHSPVLRTDKNRGVFI